MSPGVAQVQELSHHLPERVRPSLPAATTINVGVLGANRESATSEAMAVWDLHCSSMCTKEHPLRSPGSRVIL
ncbi:hypothetical protein DVH05_013603 [Phytophthora capsici]|nr:hypothetical protein DVH05_013603 [Phytophthora capsici]